MNPKKLSKKKLKALMILGVLLLLVLIVVLTIYSNWDTINDKKEEEKYVGVDYMYGFDQSVNLNNINPNEKYPKDFGTEQFPAIVIPDDIGTDVFYRGGRVYVEVNEGYDVYSTFWVDEGCAKYINEPTFGTLQKFVVSPHAIAATYHDVTLKEIISYTNELLGLGFNDIIRNEELARDVYCFNAKKGNITITMNYEKGSLYMTVFE